MNKLTWTKAFPKFLNNTRAQVAIEYLLLVVVMVGIILGMLLKIKDNLKVDNVYCQTNPQSFGCKLSRPFRNLGTDGTSFRYFNLKGRSSFHWP